MPGKLIRQNPGVDVRGNGSGARKINPGSRIAVDRAGFSFYKRQIRLRSKSIFAGEKAHYFASLFAIGISIACVVAKEDLRRDSLRGDALSFALNDGDTPWKCGLVVVEGEHRTAAASAVRLQRLRPQ